MAKYFIGAVGALLGALGGAWLMLAPSALAYQPAGADWADPTYVDFWTGLPLLIISLVGLVMFVLGLVEELRRRGIVERRAEPQAQQAQAAGTTADGGPSDAQEGNMERVLLPLVTAMLKDMQDRESNRGQEVEVHRTDSQGGPSVRGEGRSAQR